MRTVLFQIHKEQLPNIMEHEAGLRSRLLLAAIPDLVLPLAPDLNKLLGFYFVGDLELPLELALLAAVVRD